MNTLHLDTIRAKMDFTAKAVENCFKRAAEPNAMSSFQRYGDRSISLFLRLDDFSVERLESLLPEIRAHLATYRGLREDERKVLEAAEIERRIMSDNLSIGQP